MSRTVTLRLDDEIYALFRSYAKNDNRSLSNFIETSALRSIHEHEFVVDAEMADFRKQTVHPVDSHTDLLFNVDRIRTIHRSAKEVVSLSPFSQEHWS